MRRQEKASTHLLKSDLYSTCSVRVLSAPIGLNCPTSPTQTTSALCSRSSIQAQAWAPSPGLSYVVGLSVSMLVPELLFGFPGLTLDLTCSLPEDGWTVDGIRYRHQPCPACPAEVLWDWALLVRMLPLPVLWSPSAAGLPFLVEQPCFCCSLKLHLQPLCEGIICVDERDRDACGWN